jgi:predicted amidohydrolase YtcJ
VGGWRAARGRLGRFRRGARPARPPWRPQQALPAAAALESFTVAPAWLSFNEDRRGRLCPGFDADLIVVDRYPLADPSGSVAEAELVATMVAGAWVHHPGW